MKTIDLTPSWTTAASIYIQVLENKNASSKSRKEAKEEIMRMASIADYVLKGTPIK
jgi:hypothetical protein